MLPITGRGLGRGASDARARRRDRFEDGVNILLHIRVRETHDPNTLLVDPIGSRLIVPRALSMGIAIDFDNQLRGGAVEVGDVGADAMLSPKSEAWKLITAQAVPEEQFGGR